jgi:hypothetical protein
VLSKNALTTSAPPTSAERSGLRKAAHQLAELAKTGEGRCWWREEGKGEGARERKETGGRDQR